MCVDFKNLCRCLGQPQVGCVQVEGHLARVCAAAVGILRKEGQLDTRVLASLSVFRLETPPSYFWTGYTCTLARHWESHRMLALPTCQTCWVDVLL